MVEFYSTHCPKCMVLENLMKEKGIEYTLHDDISEVQRVASENNIMGAPFGIIDNKLYNTKQLQVFITKEA